MPTERNEAFGDVTFGVENTGAETCTVKGVKAVLPEGIFSAMAEMLLVYADFKFETGTPKHAFRFSRTAKECSVSLADKSKGEEWLTGGWTDSIEYWETLEELAELTEEVSE
ncbi:hypothetical protein N1030_15905 [Desulfovibrio mangrovi]|uniref:hypothetical protein n=1 Tax=Desulfovibrio mangrovi TaxID=2976983 RepID=UPI002245CB8B|nr:hypothetical protein [Desulfovibrio mangrovi]UZP67069.1 hypothetical protein N1030_15905 [Desulfovibrio mangrovi]